MVDSRPFAEYLVQYFGFALPEATEIVDNHERIDLVAAIHAVKERVTSTTPPRDVANAYRRALRNATAKPRPRLDV
ncbi:MAG: hypothetical protein ACYC3S_18210 [Chloroflexota bacterium]